MFPRVSAAFLPLCLVSLLPFAARAQTATLTGFPHDPSGASISKAKVELLNPATGESRVQITGSHGTYTFPALRPATYTLHVTGAGFRRVTITGIQLQVDQVGRHDVSLEISTITEEDVANGTAPPLQTEEAFTGQVIASQTVVDMLLNGRNFKQLALLLPGTVSATTQSVDGTSFKIPPGYCGLPGMQATRVENLAIFREVGAGTEIEMTIPAQAAYEQRRGSGRFRVGRKSRTTREHAKESR